MLKLAALVERLYDVQLREGNSDYVAAVVKKHKGNTVFASSSQSAVNVTRDFEGCSTLRKYFGQLHYLQSRVPMGTGQEAAVPISW